jgi:hypothetical protein
VGAHDLHEDACIARGYFADGVVNSDLETPPPASRLMRKVAQCGLREWSVRFVGKLHEGAVLRMDVATRPAEKDALASSFREFSNRRTIRDRMVKKLNVDDRRGMHVRYIVLALFGGLMLWRERQIADSVSIMFSALSQVSLPPLAPTLEVLGDQSRRAMNRLHEMGFRFVQLSAMQPGVKPRELDRSARRDLLATMRRHELEPSGIDLWIPSEHFIEPQRVDRALAAAAAAVEMAADLGRVPVSMTLPAPMESEVQGRVSPLELQDVIQSLRSKAERHGVPVADHAVPVSERKHGAFFGIGIDPAAWLAGNENPAKVVTSHGSSLLSARLADLTTSGMRSPPGEQNGQLEIVEYAIALGIAGYARPVVLDARQWNAPWQGLDAVQEFWR